MGDSTVITIAGPGSESPPRVGYRIFSVNEGGHFVNNPSFHDIQWNEEWQRHSSRFQGTVVDAPRGWPQPWSKRTCLVTPATFTPVAPGEEWRLAVLYGPYLPIVNPRQRYYIQFSVYVDARSASIADSQDVVTYDVVGKEWESADGSRWHWKSLLEVTVNAGWLRSQGVPEAIVSTNQTVEVNTTLHELEMRVFCKQSSAGTLVAPVGTITASFYHLEQ